MKLFYSTLGQGQPLLILHGLFGSADNWLTHAKKYAEHYKVYLIDQRNHGRSPHSDSMSYDLMSEDLYELVAEEGLRDLLLIGHSMGGKSVLRFAQQYDFLIAKIIVADMGIKQYPAHHDAIFKGLFAVDVLHCDSRKMAEGRLSEHIQEESTKQFLLKNLYWKESGKLDWRFNLQALYSNRDELMKGLPDEKVNAETLFLRGGKSNYVPMEDIAQIQKTVLNATVQTIDSAGHWLHAEAPSEFLARSMAFLHS